MKKHRALLSILKKIPKPLLVVLALSIITITAGIGYLTFAETYIWAEDAEVAAGTASGKSINKYGNYIDPYGLVYSTYVQCSVLPTSNHRIPASDVGSKNGNTWFVSGGALYTEYESDFNSYFTSQTYWNLYDSSGIDYIEFTVDADGYLIKYTKEVWENGLFLGWEPGSGNRTTYPFDTKAESMSLAKSNGFPTKYQNGTHIGESGSGKVHCQNIYGITYDANGASNADDFDNANDILHGSSYSVSSVTPEKSGYKFTGWLIKYENINSSGSCQPGSSITVKDNITLVAQYSEDNGTNPDITPEPTTPPDITETPDMVTWTYKEEFYTNGSLDGYEISSFNEYTVGTLINNTVNITSRSYNGNTYTDGVLTVVGNCGVSVVNGNSLYGNLTANGVALRKFYRTVTVTPDITKAPETPTLEPTTPPAEHDHSYGDWVYDETYHWKECECGDIAEKATHNHKYSRCTYNRSDTDYVDTRERNITEYYTNYYTCVCGASYSSPFSVKYKQYLQYVYTRQENPDGSYPEYTLTVQRWVSNRGTMSYGVSQTNTHQSAYITSYTVTGPEDNYLSIPRKQYKLQIQKSTGIDSAYAEQDSSTAEDMFRVGQEVILHAVVSTGYTWNLWNEIVYSTPDDTFIMPWENTVCQANAIPNTYYICYHPNTVNVSEEGRMPNTTCTYDESKVLSPNAYTNAYLLSYLPNLPSYTNDIMSLTTTLGQVSPKATFTGWNTEADGSGTSFSDSTSIINLTSEPYGVVTLYAQWKYPEITLPVPTLTGYTFLGWKWEGSGVNLTRHTPIRNGSYVAQWSPNSYLVNFNPAGGTVSTASKSFIYGQKYNTLPTPVWTGHTFLEWQHAETKEKITSDTVVSTAENHTLIAQWKTNAYTVTFDWNTNYVNTADNFNPNYTGNSKTVFYSDEYGTLPNPTRDGYTFAGWYDAETSGNGSGNRVQNGTIVTKTVNHTLYAKWIQNSYNVNFDYNYDYSVWQNE